MAENKTKKQDGKRTRIADSILRMIDGMPDLAAMRVIEAFDEMPFVVRDALDDYYKAMDGLDSSHGIDAVKKSLAELQAKCEANPKYEAIFKAAKEEANQEMAELYANGDMSI